MTVNEQVVSILIMVLSGLLIGTTVDFIRYIISNLNQKSILRKMGYGVELFVWALLGALTFYILFTFKGGQWRLIDPLAQILGIFLYESLFQPYFRFVGRVFRMLIIKPIIFIIHLIFRILKNILKLPIRIIFIILTPFRKLYTKFVEKKLKRALTKVKGKLFKKR